MAKDNSPGLEHRDYPGFTFQEDIPSPIGWEKVKYDVERFVSFV